MAGDYFLKLEGIDSELTDRGHEKWLRIIAFSYQMESRHPGMATSDPAYHSGVRFAGLTVIKEIDETTPLLHGALINNARLKNGTLELNKVIRTGEKHAYMKYIMTNMSVAKIAQTGRAADRDTLPFEEITFGMETIEWSAAPINDLGRPGAARKHMWRVISKHE